MTLYALRDDSCVLHLPMNEGSGSVVYDLSRYRNNGQIVGANWTQGKFGWCLKFDGIDDYVEVQSGALLMSKINNMKEITFSAWMKTEVTGDTQYILSYGIIGDPENSIDIAVTETGKIAFFWEYSGGTDYQIVTENPVADNDWHHIITVGKDNYAAIWVDGNKAKEDTGAPIFWEKNTDRALIIGACDSTPSKFWFSGLIDEIRIYNRVLEEEQIKSLYLYYQNFEVRPCILCPRPTI